MNNIIIYADELLAAKRSFSSNDNPLSVDENDSFILSQKISDFIVTSSSMLKGETWNATRKKMMEYNELLTGRINIAQNSKREICNALTILINYIEEYEMLDTSKLEEIRNVKRQCEIDISNLHTMLNKTTTVEKKDEKTGIILTSEVPMYNRSAINSRINEFNGVIKELNKLIVKLEGLELEYRKAEKKINDLFVNVDSFGRTVKGIDALKETYFVPLVTN